MYVYSQMEIIKIYSMEKLLYDDFLTFTPLFFFEITRFESIDKINILVRVRIKSRNLVLIQLYMNTIYIHSRSKQIIREQFNLRKLTRSQPTMC